MWGKNREVFSHPSIAGIYCTTTLCACVLLWSVEMKLPPSNFYSVLFGSSSTFFSIPRQKNITRMSITVYTVGSGRMCKKKEMKFLPEYLLAQSLNALHNVISPDGSNIPALSEGWITIQVHNLHACTAPANSITSSLPSWLHSHFMNTLTFLFSWIFLFPILSRLL